MEIGAKRIRGGHAVEALSLALLIAGGLGLAKEGCSAPVEAPKIEQVQPDQREDLKPDSNVDVEELQARHAAGVEEIF